MMDSGTGNACGMAMPALLQPLSRSRMKFCAHQHVCKSDLLLIKERIMFAHKLIVSFWLTVKSSASDRGLRCHLQGGGVFNRASSTALAAEDGNGV